MSRIGGMLCPEVPDHGPLLEVSGLMYCPHSSHDGAAKGQDGPVRSKSFFTTEEIQFRPVTVAPGVKQSVVFATAETPPTNADGSRQCTKCGDSYPAGGYGAHKSLPKHLRMLGQVQ